MVALLWLLWPNLIACLAGVTLVDHTAMILGALDELGRIMHKAGALMAYPRRVVLMPHCGEETLDE